jgi:hypothetical protein
MKIKDFKKNFPPGVDVPKSLLQLFKYQKMNAWRLKSGEYSGHFFLYDKYWTYQYAEPEIIPYFIPFGKDADGSTYAFWLYKDFPIESAPVIFLGTDYSGDTILANLLEDFFGLLSLGIDELGYAVHFPPDWLNHISYAPETVRFRKWLQSKLGISMPSDPIAIVDNAKRNHPDFGKWIEEKTGIAPEKMTRPPWD